MKRCSECRRDYTDDTLSFCLDDGTPLLDGPASLDEAATAILSEPGAIATGFPHGEDRTRPQTDQTATFPRSAEAEPQGSLRNLSERQSLSAHRAAKPQGNRTKLFMFAGLAALLLVGGFFGYRYFGSNTRQIESIAVMPFVNESGNADVEYLSDGMTETLIASLSQLPNLNVKARSSVFRYKGGGIDTRTIGQELNVQAILNGRVVQRGQDLILNVELIDAQTENVLWTENYSRQMVNLVSLQSDIARDLSQKLKTKLSGADAQKLAKNYTANPEAYQLYLRGRYHWNKRSPLGLEKSIEYFNLAVAADPSYGLAYAGLADSHALVPFYGNTESADAFPKAKASALKALEIDESLAEAHATLAFVKMWHEWDWRGAEISFKRAIELNPNYPTAHHWYSVYLSCLARHNDAVSEIRKAYELDPFSLGITLNMGVVYFNARRYDEAAEQLLRALEMDPNLAQAYLFLIDTYEQKGMFEEAAGAMEKLIAVAGGSANMAAGLRLRYKAAGETGYYDEKLKLLMQRWERRGQGAYHLAEAHALRGEHDEAMAWLEKAYETHDLSLASLKVSPNLDSLRPDPRFQALLRKVGFPE